MEMIKRVDEIRVETEREANELVEDSKKDMAFEVSSYTITHKIKKDDDFYIVKLVKTY